MPLRDRARGGVHRRLFLNRRGHRALPKLLSTRKVANSTVATSSLINPASQIGPDRVRRRIRYVTEFRT
jgi:hypothetical protein